VLASRAEYAARSRNEIVRLDRLSYAFITRPELYCTLGWLMVKVRPPVTLVDNAAGADRVCFQ
jgi:hypothetical protein